MNNNVVSEIKIDVFIKYGIMLHTGLTDVYGDTIYFECKAFNRDGVILEKVNLSKTGEDPINRDELEVLLEAKKYIEENYKPSKMLNMSFS